MGSMLNAQDFTPIEDAGLPGLPNAQGAPLIVYAFNRTAEGFVQTPTAKPQATLAEAAAGKSTGAWSKPLDGGRYLWRSIGGWGSTGVAKLVYLDIDGVTERPVRNEADTADLTATANAQIEVIVAQGAIVRVDTDGNGTAIYSSLAGI